MKIAVILEVGRKRVFASARDWPGWCRSGRDEESALRELRERRARYRPIAAAAGLSLPAEPSPWEVIATLTGNATTDFGAPDVVAPVELNPPDQSDRERLAALLAACWQQLDLTVADAPLELRLGPRGGGRNRDGVAAHVRAAELAYARRIGVRFSAAEMRAEGSTARWREAVLEAVHSGIPDDSRWPISYFVRRTCWHLTDHIWEIEDRSRT